nr:retrovirus-related pol polyprotein from transposon 17.6 [Quercus suber]
MPFRLKNAGATYQRLVNRMLNKQIGRNMEVYVDDMLVKSKEELTYLDDLKQYQMKLNPKANSEKVQAIINMASPKTVKEVQKLTGRIIVLNRFVSRAMNKCLPFFKTLKQAFAWADECEAAFQEFKRYLSNPPLLSPSKEGENLYLYLAVSDTALSGALIREEDKKQLLVYYANQAFQGAESKYPKIEKITFALIVASRKLRQYFQANPILVMTDQPIKKSISKPEAAGRMVQWAIELSQFDIEYHPRTTIKAQALADFIAEFTLPNEDDLTNKPKGEYEAKEERMQKYLRLTKHLTQEFDEVEFVQIPRSQNMIADEVSKIASSEGGALEEGLMMEV